MRKQPGLFHEFGVYREASRIIPVHPRHQSLVNFRLEHRYLHHRASYEAKKGKPEMPLGQRFFLFFAFLSFHEGSFKA